MLSRYLGMVPVSNFRVFFIAAMLLIWLVAGDFDLFNSSVGFFRELLLACLICGSCLLKWNILDTDNLSSLRTVG